ncbi:MAG: ATP-dependent Clp protease ATP-binding subunit, partial [Clostridia bacterium]|nr:ATP-dependent Clp protease ATP-binding subunit [Clostridia bacterium]
MVMCAKCHKRPAVVFMTKLENGKRVNEGICVTCAKELGLPIDNLLGGFMSKMGLSAEQLSEMEQEFSEMMQSGELPEEGEEGEEGIVPTFDMRKLFQKGEENLPAEKGKESPSGEKSKHASKNKKSKFLDAYCTNLTERAREGKLDAIIGRERELERMIQILCRRQKNNPCLIGEPGVGKTAVVEALAQRIVAGTVPYKLSDKELYLLDLTALVSGTQFRGQFESR